MSPDPAHGRRLLRLASLAAVALLPACTADSDGDDGGGASLPGFYYVSEGNGSAEEWELHATGRMRMRRTAGGCVREEVDGEWNLAGRTFELTRSYSRGRQACSLSFSPWYGSSYTQTYKIARTTEFGFHVCASDADCRIPAASEFWLRVEEKALSGVLAAKDTAVAFGTPIRLFAENTLPEAAVAWEWKLGRDGEFRAVARPETLVTAPWAADPAFPCIVRMTAASGTQHLDTLHVEVTGSALSADAGADRTVSIGDPVRLVAGGADVRGLPLAFAWDIGGTGEFRAAGPETTLVAPSQPVQALRCILRAEAGGVSALDTLILRVLLDPPVADAGRDTTIPIHDPLILSGSGRDSLGRIVKYEWALGPGGAFAEHAGGTAPFPDLGLGSRYPAILRVTDEDGNADTDTAYVTVGYRVLKAKDHEAFRANTVQALPDGGFVMGGKKEHTVWVGRFTALGLPIRSQTYQWAKDKHADDFHGERIAFDAGGNAVAAGTASDEPVNTVLTLTRIGADGAEKWRKTLTSPMYRGSPAGLALNGKSEALFLYNRDVNLTAFDSLGTQLWQMDLDSLATAGGVLAWGEGECAVWGATQVDGVSVHVIQHLTYGPGGRKNWQVLLTGEDQMSIQGARKVADGAIFYGGYGGMLKLAPDGKRLWFRKHSVHSEDALTGLAPSPLGGYLMVGRRAGMGTGRRAWALRTDADGQRIWTRDYPDAGGFFNTVDALANGRFAVAGTVGGFYDSGAWIAVLDENGDIR